MRYSPASILVLGVLVCMGSLGPVASFAGSPGASRLLEALREPESSVVLIAAHRGGYETDQADRAPENSVANIANCAAKGYALYETDIQRTKDGHFVIVHDATLDRETSGMGKASELSFLELKQLQKRYRDRSLSDERVASLEEFLKEGKGKTVFKADLKPGVNQYFGDIMNLVRELDALEGIIFRVPYRDIDLYSEYLSEGGASASHLFMFMVVSKKQIDDVRKRFGSSTIQVNVDRQDPANEDTLELIRYATQQGFLVETHAEGDASDWAKLREAGVRIFHTKAPMKVKAFLESGQ